MNRYGEGWERITKEDLGLDRALELISGMVRDQKEVMDGPPKRERRMTMKSLLTVTLDAKQIREACAAFVRGQLGYDLKDEAIATMGADNTLTLTVIVSKKRVRKQKTV